ncbi:MAG: hypothetical protein MUC43_11230 [Pirellula sp.]|nr:hypothetical protein [Pirellula sp.]
MICFCHKKLRYEEASVCHVVHRCVRDLPLLGLDETTGKDYSYRREWIRQRLEKLASVFAVDILAYAILPNRFHVVLRNRPDLVSAWSDKEAALRWMQIFQGKRSQEPFASPSKTDVQALANDSEKLAAVRSRLSDLSWFVKTVAEPIARMANLEEKLTGPFWEGGFKAQRLLDEVGLLSCCMHIDLNPIRVGMAKSIQESEFTSGFDRLKASQGKMIESAAVTMQWITQKEMADPGKKGEKRTGPKVPRDAWLAPLTINPRKTGPVQSKTVYRASDKGFLSMTLDEYLELLEYTARQGRSDERVKSKSAKESQASLPVNAILARFGIAEGMWCELVWNFKKYYGRSRGVGSPKNMSEDATLRNHSFYHGQRSSKSFFTQ